ncbi:MAG: hypothetical protein QXH20_07090 [Candidatus Bathyarchaeia archaeon]
MMKSKLREDPVGFPDWTYPITIRGMTIESLAVNIAAQTIPALKVDISAQSLEALNVNVSGCAVTLNVHEVGTANVAITSSVTLNVNIASQTIAVQVTNPAGESLSVAITGSVTLDVRITGSAITIPVHEAGTANVAITESITLNMQIVGSTISVPVTNPVGESLNVAITSSVGLNVTITGSTINVPVTTAAGQHLDVDVISAVTLNVNITGSAITIPVHEAGTANVAIKDSITLNMNIVGSTINVPVVNPAGQSLNVAITSSVTLNIAITGSTINVPVTTAAGQHVDVDIVSSVTINVAIQSCPVTLNVNIASQSVDINIKTSSGANIVIDKLTQGAYTERRSVLENNGTTPTMMNWNKTYARGKFFPRGCRGFIRFVNVYCDNLDSSPHVLTVHLTVAPGMGDVYSATLTLDAGSPAAWYSVTLLKMWQYDSLFVWIESDSDAYGRIGYDTGTPHDAYYSANRIEWDTDSRRFWINVTITGETVGDLPVSGTVNAVQVPNLSSFISSGTAGYGVQPGQSRTIAHVIGAGVCHRLLLWASDDALNFHIYADGVKLYLLPITPLPDQQTINVWYALYYLGGLRSGIMVQVLRSDPNTDNYVLEIAIPIHFRRELLVVAQNPYTDRVCYAAAAVAVSKIS